MPLSSAVSRLWGALSRLNPKSKLALIEDNIVFKQPHEILQLWLLHAQRHAPESQPNEMCVATIGEHGQPVTRVATVDTVSEEGIAFFTAFADRKAAEIRSHPQVSLQFHWPQLKRTVRVSGKAHMLPHARVVRKFRSYPRYVQERINMDHNRGIPRGHAAFPLIYDEVTWSWDIALRKDLVDVPVPVNWSGFVVKPTVYEFGRIHSLTHKVDYLRFRKNPKQKKPHVMQRRA